MQQQFERLEVIFGDIRDRMDRQYQRIDQMQREQPRQHVQVLNAMRLIRQSPNPHDEEDEDYAEDDEIAFVGSVRRARGVRNERRRHGRRDQTIRDGVDRNIESIKMTIPPFQGRNDPDAFIEWERKVELVFDCHNYSEEKKVKLASMEFTDYAIVWYDKLGKERRRNHERPIETWEEIKTVMRRRFVPSYYYRDLHLKLQSLRQGTRSMEDYHKEMEIALIRANIEEDEEATMAKFLCGLNREIANVMELQHYMEIEEMVSMAMKVERQLKRGRLARQEGGSNSGSSSNWKSKWGAGSRLVEKPKLNAERSMSKCQGDNKERDSGEIETEDEESDSMPTQDDSSSDYEYAAEGNALVIMRALNAQIKEEERDDVQMENIFHTRCQVKDRVYEDQLRIKRSICEKSEEFGDVFPTELPNRLPPIRGIEHQIDFVPGAAIPNRPTYRSNPEETKELQKQVDELLAKGHVRESMSPCAVP
ncbi:hypothetical protein CRG98_042681, partial [Punica granatum]